VENRQSDLAASVTGLRQTLAATSQRMRSRCRHVTSADAVSVRFAGVPYLAAYASAIDADVAWTTWRDATR
jgi:hypothetical protein